MTPGTKRTIITSRTTGRRYFLVRSASRPGGRRYYVCSNPKCKARVSREADLHCRAHLQNPSAEIDPADSEDTADNSTKSDQIDDNDIDDNGAVTEEEMSMKSKRSDKSESNPTEQPDDNANDDSESKEITDHIPTDSFIPLSPSSEANRQIQVEETTGARSFRDSSGRRRYLCTQPSCGNMLRRQSDAYCRVHLPGESADNDSEQRSRTPKRQSPPIVTDQAKKNRYRSPFQAALPPSPVAAPVPENGTHANQPSEYQSAAKPSPPPRPGTHRSFRDASGKLRFLCSLPTCHSRVPRQSELYCRRHTIEAQMKALEGKTLQAASTNGETNEDKDEADHMHRPNDAKTSTGPSTFSVASHSETKKRKREYSTPLSAIPSNQILLAATTLLDDQWNDVLSFIRRFPQVQLSSNLNVNNLTTHLLVDDSEHHLHCTITKKIVQAAVRQHVFIISTRWLNDCMRRSQFVDEHTYEIQSDSHTTLRPSRHDSTVTNRYLFNPTSQCAFAIECRQCQGSINRSELTELIQLTGAELFRMEHPVTMLIVLCDVNDKNLSEVKKKYSEAPATTIKYVTSDFFTQINY